MLPANVAHKEKARTVNGSLLHDKEGILYKEPEGFQAIEFPKGEPETATQRLAQTTSHVNRYAMQLEELYRVLLKSSLTAADSLVAGRFNSLLSELHLLTGVNKARAEVLMQEELRQTMASKRSEATKELLNEVIINVAPDFSGRLTVYVENGELKAYRPYSPEEILATLGTFIELAERAGWKVTPPEEE